MCFDLSRDARAAIACRVSLACRTRPMCFPTQFCISKVSFILVSKDLRNRDIPLCQYWLSVRDAGPRLSERQAMFSGY